MLQFAYGKLRLHILGNIILALVLFPALVLASLNCGATCAGKVLFFANLLFIVFWVPLVHRRFMSKAVWRWPFIDILPIGLVSLIIIWIATFVIPADAGRLMTLFLVIAAIICSASAGMLVGSSTRKWASSILFWRGKA